MAILVAGSTTGDITELIAPNHKIKELTLFYRKISGSITLFSRIQRSLRLLIGRTCQ